MVNKIEWLQTTYRQNVKCKEQLSELTKPYPIIDILQTNGGILMGKKSRLLKEISPVIN
jgi:hypothetical protein